MDNRVYKKSRLNKKNKKKFLTIRSIFGFFKCPIFTTFTNRLILQNGKKHYANKLIYWVFQQIKLQYNLRGILCIYEMFRLLNPYVALLPYQHYGETRYYAKPIFSVRKQIKVSLAYFSSHMHQVRLVHSKVPNKFLVLMELVQLVLKRESSILRQREKIFVTKRDHKDQIFIHYKW